MSYYGAGVSDPTGMAQLVAGRSAPQSAKLAGSGFGGMLRRVAGCVQLLACTFVAVSLLTWSVADPSLTHSASGGVSNWMGAVGAIVSDLLIQLLGIASIFLVLPPTYWALQLANQGYLINPKRKLVFAPLAVACLAMAWSSVPELASMPLRHGYGGVVGDIFYTRTTGLLSVVNATRAGIAAGLFGLAVGLFCLQRSFGLTRQELKSLLRVDWTIPAAPAVHGASSAHGLAAHAQALAPQPQAWQQAANGPGAAHFAPAATAWDQTRSIQVGAEFGAAGYAHYAPPSGVSCEPLSGDHQRDPRSGTPLGQPEHAPYASPAAVAPGPRGPARQAWLRPMAPRRPGMAGIAKQDAVGSPERLSATDRRHAPAFDRDTMQQSRAIAERFAPTGADIADTPRQRFERIEPQLESLLPPVTDVREPVAPTVREPEIILQRPHQVADRHAPVVDRAVTVAPGGFFARLTNSQRNSAGSSGQSYRRPALNLLRHVAPTARPPAVSAEFLRGRSHLLLETLGDFGIKGEIVAVRPGPVVTLFEFEPARGTKSSRVIGLADDIARSMSARAVRIAVVPGVNAIGIELPNATREAVGFRELLETEAFRSTAATLPLALGKGIGGEPVIADLTRMPHLLVAGTTGSGKSVGVNAMILSLLYHLSPDDCRMILIDPKMLELSVYNGIPHLLTPVVTDPHKAIAALNWAVGEMESRYRRMSVLSVRNIEVYNARVAAAARSEAADLPAEHVTMPHIVIVVDEFADLMAVAGKEIEFAVQRLAQMARAAGIHLIMATQRPSVDIITGTIKANFPTRISFRVTSRIDSRTILNEQGAEQLLGQGDMLFANGGGAVVRVHGPFVSDDEVETIATYLRSLGAPDYVDGLTDTPELDAAAKAPEVVDEDHLYDRAVALVLADQKASISYLQRKLSVGYNRAAGLVERMEHDGLISPPNGSGRRDVLPAAPSTPPASDSH